MDLLELAINLVEKGGAVAGVGGGYIATRVLNTFKDGLKDAKAARKKADDGYDLIVALRKDFDILRADLANLGLLGGAFRGSSHDLDAAAQISSRLTGLETRMSSIEDDYDEKVKEDKRSWDSILRAVGRLEGAIQRGLPGRDT